MNIVHRIDHAIPTRLRPYFTLYVGIGLCLSIVSLFIFGKLVDGVSENESIVLFDMALANALHSVATTGSTSLFITISLFGGTLLYAWSAVFALVLAVQRRWLTLLVWLVTILGGQLLNTLLKSFFARPRPTFASPLVIEQYYSFPSGHAMMSFIAYGMLAYVLCVLLRNNFQRFLVVLAGVAIIFLIGLSRIALGVHYFSDVVAGYAVASLWLITCITAWRYVQQRKHPRTTTPPAD